MQRLLVAAQIVACAGIVTALSARSVRADVSDLPYNGNHVHQYDVGADGSLAPKQPARAPAGSLPSAFASSPDGRSLYVANLANAGADVDNGEVSLFDVPAGGALVPKQPPRVAAADEPDGIAVSPDGRNLYVANFFGRSISHLPLGSGGLPAGPPVTTPAGGQLTEVVVDRDGRSLYAASYSTGTILQYDIGRSGAITAKTPASVPARGGPRDLVLTPDGRSLYVARSFDRDVAQYDVGPGGRLSPKDPPAVPGRTGSFGLAVSGDGHSLYVANIVSSEITQYDIGLGGRLAAKSPWTVGTGPGPYSVAASPDGRGVYVSNVGGDSISQYDVDLGGRLAASDPETVATGPLPRDMLVSHDGASLYAVTGSVGTVFEYVSGDPITGGVTRPLGLAARDDTPPRISRFGMTRRRFTLAGAARSRFRFELSEHARVTITIERARPGIRSRGARICIPSRSGARARGGGRRCTAYARAGVLRGTVNAGRVQLPFGGRIGGRRLAPATYRATIRARDGSGNSSAPRRLRFEVLRRQG